MWFSDRRHMLGKASFLNTNRFNIVGARSIYIGFITFILLYPLQSYSSELDIDSPKYKSCTVIQLYPIIEYSMQRDSTRYGPAANENIINTHYKYIHKLIVERYGKEILDMQNTCVAEAKYEYYSDLGRIKINSTLYYRATIHSFGHNAPSICIYRKVISGIGVPIGETPPTEKCYN